MFLLSYSWKKLIADEDTEVNFEGSRAEEFLHMLQRAERYLPQLMTSRISWVS